MRRGLAAVIVAVGVAAGSGIAVARTHDARATTYQPPAPTKAELAYRKTYLADQLSGDPVRASCGCTGALRAKERADKLRLHAPATPTTTPPAP